MVHVAPARPAYAAGLRAAVATVGPLLLGALGILPAATWASLGGFDAALADKGGAYRTRALTMAAVAGIGSLSAVIATAFGGVPWLAVLLMLLWGTGSGLARVYGAAGASIGTLVMSIFLISLSAPPHTPAEGLMRGALLLGGATWAMAIALVLWPLRPYRPLRLAVAQVYRLLAVQARLLARSTSEDDLDETSPLGARARMREALEGARAALASHRRGRPGESGRGERLLVLIEAADQQWGFLVALRDLRAGALADAGDPALDAELSRLLEAYADTADAVATVTETDGPPLSSDRIPPVEWTLSAIRDRLDAPPASTRARWTRAVLLLDRLRQQALVAMDTAASINGERPMAAAAEPSAPADQAAAAPPPSIRVRLRGAIAPLRANLTLDSVVMRHALRLGITMAAAELTGRLLHLHRAYWVTLTVLVILQPYTGATFIRAVQRVAGTVLGAILAALIGAAIHNALGVLVVVFVLAAICVAVLPLNYGAFSVFLTPTFVLLAEVNAGDWHLAPIRATNTLLGGALALVGSQLLWPAAEREEFSALMASALRASRALLRQAVAAFSDPSAFALLAGARRDLGLAITNAEATLPGILARPGRSQAELEGYMAFTTYLRRLAAALVALALGVQGSAPAAASAKADVELFGAAADKVLAELEQAASEAREPPPLPDSWTQLIGGAGDDADPMVMAQLDRVARPLRVIRDAVARVGVKSELGRVTS